MLKRILAVLTALIMCMGIVGCSKSDAPEGMKLVSIEGEPFKLYVPEGWTDNAVSGISGAFFAGTDNIAVSARYYTPTDEEQSLEDYVNSRISSYTQSHEDFEFNGEVISTVLGGENAKEIVFCTEYQDKDFTFREVFVKYNGDFIVLSCRCPEELYESYNATFTQIIEVFELCEKGEVKNDCVTDKKTPDGMKIASDGDIEYRFYVPTSWVCDSESGSSMAYIPESGKPNMTVTAYISDDVMSVEEYFELCEEKYEDNITGYEFIGKEEREVGKCDAVSYTYKATYGGTDFTIMQTVLSYNDRLYSLTYTAPADLFDAHIEDVEAILDAFRFR